MERCTAPGGHCAPRRKWGSANCLRSDRQSRVSGRGGWAGQVARGKLAPFASGARPRGPKLLSSVWRGGRQGLASRPEPPALHTGGAHRECALQQGRSCWLRPPSIMGDSAAVVVVGAGLSGLTCASRLLDESGVSQVTVLEASNREKPPLLYPLSIPELISPSPALWPPHPGDSGPTHCRSVGRPCNRAESACEFPAGRAAHVTTMR